MKMNTDYCVVLDSDGSVRKKRAPEWWKAAVKPIHDPAGQIPAFYKRAPWETDAIERRQVSRMLAPPDMDPAARRELNALKFCWDNYSDHRDTA